MRYDKETRLIISGVEIVAGSDYEISVTVSPISEAGELRRTVNGDLISMSRPRFRKYAIEISGNDRVPPGIEHLMPGDYAEVQCPDRMIISGNSWDRPMSGITAFVSPSEQVPANTPDLPASAFPLSASLSTSRLALLRTPWTAQFPLMSNDNAISGYPVFACLVKSWSTDKDEMSATTSWSLSLEEI